MFLKSYLFLFGFGLTVISLSYIVIYLNLLTIGYNFSEYVKFISRRIECINVFLGILLMFVVYKFGGKNELYI